MDTSQYNLWEEFDDCAECNGWFVDKVKPTGYCMIDAVRLSVLYDCNKLITFEGLKAKITNKLCTDNSKYLNIKILNIKKACDLLLLVIADVLRLNIFVHQKNLADETIQVLPIPGDNFDDEVHLIFTHNNRHPGGNHYDTVILNAENRKMKNNGTLCSTGANQGQGAQSTAKSSSATHTQAQPKPTNQKETVQPKPAKEPAQEPAKRNSFYKR